jgi:hypothetical protein
MGFSYHCRTISWRIVDNDIVAAVIKPDPFQYRFILYRAVGLRRISWAADIFRLVLALLHRLWSSFPITLHSCGGEQHTVHKSDTDSQCTHSTVIVSDSKSGRKGPEWEWLSRGGDLEGCTEFELLHKLSYTGCT